MMISKWFKYFIGFGVFIAAVMYLGACESNDLPGSNCDKSDLVVDAVGTNPVDCNSKGSVELTAAGGEAPYKFALDNEDFGSSPSFTGVVAGSHIARVRDNNGCVAEIAVFLENPNSTLQIDEVLIGPSGCETENGSLEVNASGGNSLSYSMDNDDYNNTTGIFTDLAVGTYAVYVKDDENCVVAYNNLKVTTGVSYENDIKPILEANCIKSGCHNGDNGQSRDWSKLSNVQAKAGRIKQLTANGSMPEDDDPLPQEEIDLIACWVDDGALDN